MSLFWPDSPCGAFITPRNQSSILGSLSKSRLHFYSKAQTGNKPVSFPHNDASRPTPPLQRFHIGKWTQLLHTSTPKQSPDMTCHLYSTGTLAILLSLFDNGHRQGKKSGAKSEPTLKIMNVRKMSDTKLGRTRYTCRLVVK